MKKTILLLCFLVCYYHASCQLPAGIQVNHKLRIEINKNVELLGFAYFIAFEGTNSETKKVEINGKEMLEKDWQNYGFYFYQQYKSFAGSKNMVNALSVAEHLWLSDIIPLLLQVDDFPDAKLPEGLSEADYIGFSKNKNPKEAKQNVILFLNACNELYKEVNFDKYLSETEGFYQSAIKQVAVNLPNFDFIGLTEAFYRKQFDHYVLIPSLTLPKSMGFGLRYTRQGSTKVFNVFGAVDFQSFLNIDKIDMGFGNKDKLRELSIHEFGHSFVNPEVYKLSKSTFDSTAVLFEPLREAMEKQGYNTWESCIIEHFVRAGEVVIAEKTEHKNSAERLKDEYINKRSFIYLPIIIEELNAYSLNGQYEYLEMAKRSMQRIKKLVEPKKPNNLSTFPANPKEAVLHTEDIANFWKLFDKSYPAISAKLLQEEYIEKGSAGVKGFLKNRIENGRLLSKTVRDELKYYEFIRPYTLSIESRKARFYECFENLKKIYPPAVFPDVYFVIGRNNTGGTAFREGLIIGAERFGEEKNGFKPALHFDYLDEIVSHELIHFQQKYVKDNTLLAQCIREGAADFLCELIAGDHSSSKTMYEYGESHRKELWEQFLISKDLNDWTGWLYYQKDKSRPKDLGYWIGYKICKSYYNRTDDKTRAIAEILNITDFKAFLQKSGYQGE